MDKNMWRTFVCDWNHWAIAQVATPCIGRSSILKRRRRWISSRIVHNLLTNCSEMLILVSSWRPDKKGLWINLLVRSRLISYIHHTSEYKQYCCVGNTAQQCRLGSFQDTVFCRRPSRLKINIRRGLVYFRKSHVCADQLDVQETDSKFTRFYRSWNHFSRCRFTHGRNFRSHSLGFGDWNISFRTEQKQKNQERATRQQSSSQTCTPHPTNIDHVPSSTTNSGQK